MTNVIFSFRGKTCGKCGKFVRNWKTSDVKEVDSCRVKDTIKAQILLEVEMMMKAS